MKILTPNKNKETAKAIHTNKQKYPIQLGSTQSFTMGTM